MVAFMHTGTRLTAGYRYTTLGDATRPALYDNGIDTEYTHSIGIQKGQI